MSTVAIRRELIESSSALAPLSSRIVGLFEKCFRSSMDSQLWQWAYMSNPNGSPIVAVAYNSENILIGHYAVIPVSFADSSNVDKRTLYLSMTTMVDPEYVGEGLFQLLAEMVYGAIAARGNSLVYGFPNSKSINGFKKRLNWQIQDCLISSVTSTEADELLTRRRNNWSFSLDEPQLSWRMSRPGARYEFQAGCVLKKSSFGLDLIGIGNRARVLDVIGESQRVNLLLHREEAAAVKDSQSKVYPMGMRIIGFDPDGINELGLSMAMSDVF